MVDIDITNITFDKNGLVPAVVTDSKSKELLMLAYMNKEALLRTLELRCAVFFSRSKQDLWYKGATSGNVLEVITIKVDCDADCVQLEVVVQGEGVVCHTGARSCFFHTLFESSR